MKAPLTLDPLKRSPTPLLASGAMRHAAVHSQVERATLALDGVHNADTAKGHDFSRVQSQSACPAAPTRCPFGGACHTCPLPVQAKLKVQRPRGRYEQEAGQVAEESAHMEKVQLRLHPSSIEMTPIPFIVYDALHSSARPLDPVTREDMETRLGHDLSDVKVHTGIKAAESAHELNAQAYAIGNHILFGTGRWAPSTIAGQELLVHELVHTIQQSKLPGLSSVLSHSGRVSMGVEPSDTIAEREARLYARQAMSGTAQGTHHHPEISRAAGFSLQRRTVREEYATAAYETGPLWDVTLIISNAPDGESENLEEFVNACMDGIRSAAWSLGRGRGVRSRNIRVRIRYRRNFDYVDVERRALDIARRSVLPETPQAAASEAPQSQATESQPSQSPQSQPAAPQAPTTQPEPPRTKTVIVIGSPSPGQAYGFQFVNAALCHPRDANTIWLVEHSGYAMIYGTNPGFITDQAPTGGYEWITPSRGLVAWINSVPDGSIGRLIVYSHGVPGVVALRYGWEDVGMPNYGLNLQDVARLSPSKFAPDAAIEFNSCNTGTPSNEGNLAQAFANRSDRPVQAWTGRTSYAEINRGTCQVRGSRYSLSTDAIAEFWSRQRAGGPPQLRTFTPGRSATATRCEPRYLGYGGYLGSDCIVRQGPGPKF